METEPFLEQVPAMRPAMLSPDDDVLAAPLEDPDDDVLAVPFEDPDDVLAVPLADPPGVMLAHA